MFGVLADIACGMWWCTY